MPVTTGVSATATSVAATAGVVPVAVVSLAFRFATRAATRSSVAFATKLRPSGVRAYASSDMVAESARCATLEDRTRACCSRRRAIERAAAAPTRRFVAVATSPAPVAVGKAKLAVLDPVVMQNLFARHAAFDGTSFVVAGRVERQRALSAPEARALATKVGVGARYRVMVDVVDGETLDVTVHEVDAPLAAALQAKMGEGVRVVVRVRVVGKDDARVVSLFASARKLAWALVATRMA